MEDLPTLGEFRIALQRDTAFRDYLNTYLRLPVFSRRLTYCAQKDTWIIEPSFVATYYFTEDEAILAWVHERRLPLFWDTDLFYEYRLARKLVENNEVLDSSLQDSLLTVYGMERFRHFLFATEGDSSCIFWMDVERLKRASDDPPARNKILAKISTTFLNDGASFSLKQEVKQIILSFKRNGSATDSESHFAVRMRALSHVQLSALRNLRTYWMKRYMDGMAFNSTPCHVRRMSDACAGMHFTPKSPYLPKIITARDAMKDSRQPKAAAQLFTVSQPRLLPVMSSGRLGTATTNTKGAVVNEVQKAGTITKNSLMGEAGPGNQLRSMFTTSAELLFPKLTASESVHTTARLSHSNDEDSKLHHSLLCTSIRADFVAGNPFLRYLSTCSRLSQDHVLFWWSVELILMQDEMKRYYRSRVSTEDCPYLTSFETQPVAQTLTELQRLFIEEGARHPVSLPQPLLHSLGTCLRKGMGWSLLLYAQEHVIEKILPVWKEYLLHDNDDFIKSCVTERVLCGQPLSYQDKVHTSLSTTTSEEMPLFVFGSGNMDPVWRSLKLSEAAKYPGISHLPSRQWQGVAMTAPCLPAADTPTTSHGGQIALNDAALDAKLAEMVSNPMITTIFRAHRQDIHKSRHVLLCVTKPANISSLKRPPHPRGYTDILKDAKQLRFFEHFLSTKGNNSEARLQFWLAVEDLKSIHKKSTMKHQIAKIEQRFLGRKAEKMVGSQVAEFLGSERLTLAKLLTAQAMISDHMESTWYKPYLDYLRVDEEQEKKPASLIAVQETVEHTRRTFHCKERTKILWTTFAHLVVNFRRGLMNPATAEQFHLFLRKEVTRGVISRDGTKIMVGKKMVMVTKLLNDLSFWAEVERYKDIFDMLSASKISGYHVPEDDIIIHKKVTAIVNCYIDSVVIPKVQINTSAEIAERIIRNVAQGHITRGLFHEAALSIFSILTVYWKKFCLAQFSTPQKLSWSKLAMDRLAMEDSKVILDFTIGLPNCYSLSSFEHSSSQLFDGPILSFSLHHGLRWYKTRTNNQVGIDLQNLATLSSSQPT